ncbi:hypothetical protein [Butyrivibrio sp. AE3003]|uniref:hypothetical protein n=1 Tax=Butyrivibrio sp. AE3003 TaxID=1496721 RepID=UPI00047A4A2C|nr:hypothetical protein [Butyrivibrio sp. AE3003]
MVFDVSEVLADARMLSQYDFFAKYFLGDDNWYIEKYLGHVGIEATDYITKYKKIVSEGLGIDQTEVYMSGSAKLGFSLSPPQKDKEEKLFKPFNDDEKIRKISDIDVAVVSDKLFSEYWMIYRQSYKKIYEGVYNPYVFREIYRGIINEGNVEKIEGCRKKWNLMVIPIKAKLRKELFFKHDITFRVYRNKEDFEDYTKNIYRELRKRSDGL